MKIRVPRPVTVDFETFRIEQRPAYPPVPVGVSVKYPGKAAKYYAWGHPAKNNCTFEEGRRALADAYEYGNKGDGLLFQNGKFDVDVAEVHLGLPVPPWDKIHDTLFLLFLDDPHQKELGLKPAAERLLGMPPDEQDKVRDWLLEHQPLKDQGIRITDAKGPGAKHPAGAYIAYAPGSLVGKYANGDTIRTEKLFKHLYEKTCKRGMLEAYDRERRLMPILLESERNGVPVALGRLKKDCALYTAVQEKLSAWIKKRVGHDFNVDSDAQLLSALVAAKKVDVNKLLLTPTGKYSAKDESLSAALTDKQLKSVLAYRTQLGTCLSTFMLPWLDTARKSGGLIFTTWNQTRQERGGGTRTGRLSSTPNFQNIPKEFGALFKHEESDAKKARALPAAPFDLPAPPVVRGYIVPPKGHVFIDRDYSQQEPRILAHFDGGALLEAYQNDPWVDFHDFAKLELERVGKYYERKAVKTVNLSLMYGKGEAKLAEDLDITVEESRALKKAVSGLYPGLEDMYRDMKVRARNNEPIRTWGGREYYCEPPVIAKGRLMTFEYKLVNILIQGSAADCTKEALIRHDATKHAETRLLIQVHDEILASCPRALVKQEMETLRLAMESVEFDAQMLSEGEVSAKSWGDFKPYDSKGKRVK